MSESRSLYNLAREKLDEMIREKKIDMIKIRIAKIDQLDNKIKLIEKEIEEIQSPDYKIFLEEGDRY